MAAAEPLASWTDGAAKSAILEFVRSVSEPATRSSGSPRQSKGRLDQ